MASDLTELLEWVKANDGPNRTLDLAIAQALGQPWACMDNPPAEPGGDWWPSRIRCERFTASLDASLALVERVLPGWAWSVDSARESAGPTDDPRPHGTVRRRDGRPWPCGGATPALALLAALLTALAAQGDVGGDQLK